METMHSPRIFYAIGVPTTTHGTTGSIFGQNWSQKSAHRALDINSWGSSRWIWKFSIIKMKSSENSTQPIWFWVFLSTLGQIPWRTNSLWQVICPPFWKSSNCCRENVLLLLGQIPCRTYSLSQEKRLPFGGMVKFGGLVGLWYNSQWTYTLHRKSF